LLPPCQPQPTTPMVMRLDGAGRAPCPNTLEGMIVGAAIAIPVAAIKCRRLILEFVEEVFMPSFNHGLFFISRRKLGRTLSAVPPRLFLLSTQASLLSVGKIPRLWSRQRGRDLHLPPFGKPGARLHTDGLNRIACVGRRRPAIQEPEAS